MRRLFYLIIFQFMFLQTAVFGQMFFTVELQDDNVTYIVKVRPNASFSGTESITNNAQLTFVVPTGGFKADNLQNMVGNWVNDNNVVAPDENPDNDYLVFNLSGNISDVDYEEGQELSIFSFQNVGECTGTLDFIDPEDPFFFNSKNINIGNQISVFGAGFINAFSGTYGPEANCLTAQVVGEICNYIDTVITINPSQCGLVGGSIIISASIDNGLRLSYSIDGGESFQTDSVFNDLVAGKKYEVWVKDEIPLCIEKHGVFELGLPADAIIIGTNSTPDSCMGDNGTIDIEAVPVLGNTILEYSIDSGATWLENDGLFTGLAAGNYKPRVRAKDAPCHDDIDEIVVAISCNMPTDTMTTDTSSNNNGNPVISEGCVYTYVIDADNGKFTVSVLPDTTITGPQSTTSTAQVTIKVPTGSFEITNFESLVSGANFEENGRSNAPSEEPGFDYIVFGLTTLGSRIDYTKGVKIPLFSFENGGNCTGNQIFLMDNNTDPFSPPNSESANVGQQITVAATGSNLSIVCNQSNEISDCGEELGVIVDPPLPSYATDTIYVSLPVEETTTVCIGDELEIDAGDLGTVSLCNIEGTVITTLSDGSNCLEITTDDHFNQTETICIVHFDSNNNNISDTTILILCPQVNLGDDLSICAGETITLNPLGGTGNFTWITTGNISCTDCANPEITPDANTQYILMSTEGDQCINTDTLMVNVTATPTVSDVTPTQPTDCQENGQIAITAQDGVGGLKYSIDNGTTFQDSPQFDNLGAGDFEIIVANQDETCPISWTQAVSLTIAGAPSFVDVNVTPPNECRNEQGAIEITALGSMQGDVLEYSIDGGSTWQATGAFPDLAEGGYNLAIRILGSGCAATFANNPVEVSQAADLRITTTPGDKVICSEGDKTIELELNETITDHNITGGTFSNEVTNGNILTFEVDPATEGSLYSVTLTGESGCTITEEFTLTPGEDTDLWTIDIETTPASCEDNDGAVAVTVNEDNNGFTFCWEPNKASGPMREGLSSDSTYSLTVTSATSSCTVVYDNIITGTTCEEPSCNIFTGLDTLNAFVAEGEDQAIACIPILGMDLSEFQFYTEGQLQQIQFGECMQTSVFYAYEVLFELGEAPYSITQWTVNNDTFDVFDFNTIEELVNKMNQFDFQANWVLNTDLKIIQGFSTANTYGSLNAQPSGSGQIAELQLNTMSEMFQSIILGSERGTKKFTIKDPLNDCEDDIYIKVQGLQDGMDTLELVTLVNTPINNQCLNTDETGTENLSIRVCNEPSAGILSDTDDSDACFGYMPNEDFVGKDFFCLELCNGDICDTTMVSVTVNEEGLIFFTGMSPNDDGINDVFTIKNIESYENNVTIYNRWGNLIFKKENYTNDEAWDGTFDMRMLPDGVYFYLVKIRTNGENQIFSGPITINR